MSLPLSPLKNPVHFSLPVDIHHHPACASASSSTKTTTSDLSSQLAISNEKGEEPKPAESEDVPSPVFPLTRMAEYLRHSVHSDSDISDSDARISNRSSHSAGANPNAQSQDQPHASQPVETNIEDVAKELALFVEKAVKHDLDMFSKFFPEVSFSPERMGSFHFLPHIPSDSLPSAANPWGEDSDSEKVTKPPVVVPTAIPTSERNADISKNEMDLRGNIIGGGLFKAAADFVEEPAPQVLGHEPSDKHEVFYSKGVSVDR